MISPIIIILFLLGLVTAYVYIALNQNKYTFSGDYKFIMFKFAIIVSTIALGFFATAFAPFIEQFPYIGTKIAGLYKIIDYPIIHSVIEYLSSLWFIFAIALLPFGHTVVNTDTKIVDNDRTQQLSIFYSAIYATPYYILMTLFSFNLFFFIVSVSDWNHATPYDTNKINPSFSDYRKTVVDEIGDIKPNLGFYFNRGEEGNTGNQDKVDFD